MAAGQVTVNALLKKHISSTYRHHSETRVPQLTKVHVHVHVRMFKTQIENSANWYKLTGIYRAKHSHL